MMRIVKNRIIIMTCYEVEIRWKTKTDWFDYIDRYRFEDVPFMAAGI